MTVQTFGDGIATSLAPWAPPDSDFANYASALAACFEAVWAIVADQGQPGQLETYGSPYPAPSLYPSPGLYPQEAGGYFPGWSTILNVEACPTAYLPWLGMFVGVYVPPGTLDATARSLIRAEQGFQRGTVGAIASAISRNLVGTQSVVILERTAANGGPDPYHFVVVIRPEELIWNLVPNPSFEETLIGDAPLGWSSPTFSGAGSTATFAAQNGWAASGSRSLRITGTAVAAGGTMSGDLSAATSPIIVGQPYSAQATFNCQNANTIPKLTITFYNSTPAVISSQTTTGTATGLQTLDVNGFLAPAGAVTAQLTWTLLNPAASAETVDAYLDAVQLTESMTAEPYVDGDTPGFEWVGITLTALEGLYASVTLLEEQYTTLAEMEEAAGDSITLSSPGLFSAVESVRPAGVRWTLIQTDEWVLSELESDYASITLLEAAFASVNALEVDVT